MIKKLTANILLLLITVISYGQKAEVIENYIKTYRTIAIEEMQRTGVPAAIKLAQGIHETMAGQSELVLNQITISVLNAKKDIMDLMYFMMTTAPRKDL